MEGFFTIPKVKASKRQTCVTCGLHNKVLSPRMEPFGNFKLGILNVGEAPGEVEDRRGRQWQGPVGQALQQAYKECGVDLFEDCLNINAINCRPTDSKGNNRPPSNREVESCRSRVTDVIKQYQPRVIMLFGGKAVESVIGHRWQRDLGTISKWRGWTIPDRGLNAWLCPQFHPSYMQRGDREVHTVWMQDIEHGLAMHKIPLPGWADEHQQVEIVEDTSFLLGLKGPVAFDFETTGLKPHNTVKHRIVCMAVCNNAKKAYAFMMPKDKDQRRNIRMFLKSNVPKIAQNMKFEHTWSQNLLNCEVQNWHWDTMLAAHVLDNRPAITSLKFQAYVQFGVIDYNSAVAPYLEAKEDKNANATNRIDELVRTEHGKQQLLTYCGMDALFEFRLAMQQQQQMLGGLMQWKT